MVDEAHATGALGPDGRGAVAEAGLEGEVDVVVGTLGKALGSYGAYVCADQEMISYLVNTARSLIFSTAPGPPAVAGALAALELLQERPHRVERLRSAARTLRKALATEGFPVTDGDMQIVPLLVGDEHAAMRLCKEALERGVFAQAIRPPTVAAGTSRLRLATMASHTAEELKMAARVLGEAARAIGLDPAAIGPRVTADRTNASERETEEPYLPVAAREHRGDAPFDLEERASAQFDVDRRAAEPDAAPISADESRSRGPFDVERERSVARAA
jgi:glycine C-acetyltransferase/8-amino-7-oxononanoate synthase